jgi:uncharacterized membrane-anchored protein
VATLVLIGQLFAIDGMKAHERAQGDQSAKVTRFDVGETLLNYPNDTVIGVLHPSHLVGFPHFFPLSA